MDDEGAPVRAASDVHELAGRLKAERQLSGRGVRQNGRAVRLYVELRSKGGSLYGDGLDSVNDKHPYGVALSGVAGHGPYAAAYAQKQEEEAERGSFYHRVFNMTFSEMYEDLSSLQTASGVPERQQYQ